MKEKSSDEYKPDDPESEAPSSSKGGQVSPGMLSRVVGGAYNATTAVAGGAVNATTAVVGGTYNATANILGGAKNAAVPVVAGTKWIAGAALSTSFGIVKGVGSYVLPARLTGVGSEAKPKSD